MELDPEHQILRPTKSSAVWLLLVSLVFVVLGILMVLENKPMGYLCAGFFGLGIPVAVVKLLPGSTYLKISQDGLTFAVMFRVRTIPWNIVDQFFVVTLRQAVGAVHKMVGFNYVPSYERSQLARVGAAIAKCHGALPDTYGMKAEALAELLNQCLVKYANRQIGDSAEQV